MADEWELAAGLSNRIHQLDELNQLAVAVRDTQATCGGCAYWMTRSCPGRVRSNGRILGPGGGDQACQSFALSSASVAWLAKAYERMAALRAELAAAAKEATHG